MSIHKEQVYKMYTFRNLQASKVVQVWRNKRKRSKVVLVCAFGPDNHTKTPTMRGTQTQTWTKTQTWTQTWTQTQTQTQAPYRAADAVESLRLKNPKKPPVFFLDELEAGGASLGADGGPVDALETTGASLVNTRSKLLTSSLPATRGTYVGVTRLLYTSSQSKPSKNGCSLMLATPPSSAHPSRFFGFLASKPRINDAAWG